MKGTISRRKFVKGAAGLFVGFPYIVAKTTAQTPPFDAPVSIPQFPNAFSEYAARPPWQVAGVDFYVGVPTEISLKAATRLSAIKGVSISGKTIIVSGNNVIIDGYNLSGFNILHRGSNLAVSNCKFLGNGATAIDSNNNGGSGLLSVTNCTFDGNQDGAPLALAPAMDLNVSHSRFTDYVNDFIDNGQGNIYVGFNLFDNLGGDPTAHNDVFQSFFQGIKSFVWEYNTFYEPSTATSKAGIDSFVRLAQQGTATINNPIIRNNSAIVQVGLPAIFDIDGSSAGGGPNTIPNVTIHDNYIDPRSAANSPIYIDSDPSITNPSTWNNINLVTGKPWFISPFNKGGVNAAPAVPGITGHSVSAGRVTVRGTCPEGVYITAFSGSTQDTPLGGTGGQFSNLALTTGTTWSFTSGVLASGSYTIVTRANDPLANGSGASNSVTVVV